MKVKKLILGITIISVTLLLLSILGLTSDFREGGCMNVIVGKNATVDGSVITSHTVDGWYDSNYNSKNIYVVPGQTFPKGSMLDVYYGMCGDELDPDLPKKIGEIPQVEKTLPIFMMLIVMVTSSNY